MQFMEHENICGSSLNSNLIINFFAILKCQMSTNYEIDGCHELHFILSMRKNTFDFILQNYNQSAK